MEAIRVYMAFSFFVIKLAPTSAVFSVNSCAYRVAKSGMFTGRYLSAYLRLKRCHRWDCGHMTVATTTRIDRREIARGSMPRAVFPDPDFQSPTSGP